MIGFLSTNFAYECAHEISLHVFHLFQIWKWKIDFNLREIAHQHSFPWHNYELVKNTNLLFKIEQFAIVIASKRHMQTSSHGLFFARRCLQSGIFIPLSQHGEVDGNIIKCSFWTKNVTQNLICMQIKQRSSGFYALHTICIKRQQLGSNACACWNRFTLTFLMALNRWNWITMNCHHFNSVCGRQPLVFVIIQKVAVNVKYIHNDDDDA